MNRTKHLLLACPAVLLLGASYAGAADLGVQPVYKAGPAAPLAYDWRGFYVGGHVGGANTSVDSATIDIATSVPIALPISTSRSGVFGGGQIGYNFMVAPNWLVGIEADISAASLRSTATETVAGTIANNSNNLDLFGTVRGRIGYTAGDWLFYGTGGYAWMHDNARRTQVAGIVNGAFPGTVELSSATLSGWAAGAGIEWGISRNVSIKAEYLHYDFQNARFAFPQANRRWDDTMKQDTVKIGVNWRLNWGP